MKTDQQAAEDKDKKRFKWIKIIQSDKYAVRSKESKLIAGIEAGRSFDAGYDAGAAHVIAELQEQDERIEREAFEAARIHPNWCDKVTIEKYVHEGDGNSAGTYWIVKKINYEYESFEDYKKSKGE